MLFKKETERRDALSHIYIAPKKIIIKDGVENPAAISKGGSLDPYLAVRSVATLKEESVLLVDFGEEISGGVRLVFHKNEGRHLRISFGESCAEALSTVGQYNSTNDHSVRDSVLRVPEYGVLEYGRTGFRFVCISSADAPIALMGLYARADFRDLEWLGSFDSSDRRLNRIWHTAARTVHLNMQELLLDGIKRDRLLWVGDMHPEVSAALALFGDNACIRESLDFAKASTPKNAWMNSFASYSLWWVMIQYDLYMHSGDKNYLSENIECMLGILAQLTKYIGNDGSISGINNFLDWSMYDNTSARDAAFGALAVMAFERGAFLCREIGGDELCEVAERLDKYRNKLFRHSYWSINKQAIAMQVLSGQKSAEEAQSSLTKDTEHGISVFYGYYVLLALSLGNNTKHALDTVKKYWGAMLDLGATTFFENFELSEVEGELPPLKIDTPPTEGYKNIYAEGGAHCFTGYRRSLCHGWASGPLAWVSRHLLGVKILEPGCKKVEVKPELAGLSWMHGTFPTPLGVIDISVQKGEDGTPEVSVIAPEGIEIVR